MRLVVILAGLALTTLSLGQTNSLKDLAEKYSGQEGYTYVYVTEFMFELASSVMKNDDPEASEMIKNIDNLLVITASQEVNSARNVRFADEINSTIDKNSYKVLLKVREADEDVDILAKEANGIIEELVITVKSLDEDVLVILDGRIDLDAVAKLSETSSIKVNGIEYLAKLEEPEYE